jgi:hypothetical protein
MRGFGRRRVANVLARLLTALLPLAFAGCSIFGAQDWRTARWDSAGIAPEPAETPQAVVQVYVARTFGWRGIFAVHSWIIFKPANASAFERYEVEGWGVGNGAPAIRHNRHAPDGYWAGTRPTVIADLRGPGATVAIVKIEHAIAAYPYPETYWTWPGPNSNSFTAYVLREVSELGAALPSTAIGKDFLPGGMPIARAPSGTGYQVSLLGVLGVTVALDEGVEVNVLGLVAGIDPKHLALKLPLVGSVGPSLGSSS